MTMSRDPRNNDEQDKPTSGAGRGAMITAILAVVLSAEAIGFSWYTYSRLRSELAPETVVNNAEQTVVDNYPEYRKAMTRQIREQAPAIAREVSRNAMAAGPETRQWLEQFAVRQLEFGLDDASLFSDESLRQFVRDNRPLLEQAMAAEASDDGPSSFKPADLEARVDEAAGDEVRNQAEATLVVHRQFNEKLARLNDASAELTPKEELERRMARILRTLEER